MSWKYSVGDVVYSTLTGQRMMVLEKVFSALNLTSEYGYKLRRGNYDEQFLYDFEVTEVDPHTKKPTKIVEGGPK